MSDLRLTLRMKHKDIVSDLRSKPFTVSTLSYEICLSKPHTRRLAAAGVIPETISTKGGHYRFRRTPVLRRWITMMQPEIESRTQIMEAAYKKYASYRLKKNRPKALERTQTGHPVFSVISWFQCGINHFRSMMREIPINAWPIEMREALYKDLEVFVLLREWIGETIQDDFPKGKSHLYDQLKKARKSN
jgi:hypothetical protein